MILDSLIWDRLASRLGHITGKNSDLPNSSGGLCIKLVGASTTKNSGAEKDSAFRDAVRNIQEWVKKRNEALHATAKVFRSEHSPKDFADILQSHRRDALDGIKYLQVFDALDRASRAKSGKRTATDPGAFCPDRRAKRAADSPTLLSSAFLRLDKP